MPKKGAKEDKVTLPTLIIPQEMWNDMKEAAKKKGYPIPLLRRKAIAKYLNGIREKEGKDIKNYL